MQFWRGRRGILVGSGCVFYLSEFRALVMNGISARPKTASASSLNDLPWFSLLLSLQLSLRAPHLLLLPIAPRLHPERFSSGAWTSAFFCSRVLPDISQPPQNSSCLLTEPCFLPKDTSVWMFLLQSAGLGIFHPFHHLQALSTLHSL